MKREVSYLSSLVAAAITHLLMKYLDENPIGTVTGPDASFQCFEDDATKIRRPDVAFLSRGRLPASQLERGHVTVAPDLVIEVISPNDSFFEVNKKIQEYVRAGVRLIWIVDPENLTVSVHRSDRTVTEITLTDEISGEDVLPGFLCRASGFFQPVEILKS
ncbi:MAG: Uma2 family endonuclease [Planctomycetes bacterium]|nr:Uma2 family endonuclease [Planctomycetota bacterium]